MCELEWQLCAGNYVGDGDKAHQEHGQIQLGDGVNC